MRASAALGLIGIGLFVGTLGYDYAESTDVGATPLIVGLVAILIAALLGLIRGTGWYRLSAATAVAGVAIVTFGMFAPLHARPDIPVPRPTENETVVLVGLAVMVLAVLVGALAMRRRAAAR